MARWHASSVVLLSLAMACGAETDLSYEEYLEVYREDHGPFLRCGEESVRCENHGPGPAAACLGEAIASCAQVEHTLLDASSDGEIATTFVTPIDDGCEIVVVRRLSRSSVGVDYQRERCDAVEFNTNEPCVHFRRCTVESRWNHRD